MLVLAITIVPVRHMACPAQFERATLGFLDRGKPSVTYLLVDRFEFLNQVN
jgi:hypothetical protein